MTIDTNRLFLETRLNEISSAVMYSQSNNPEKLPNDIVMFYKMDDCGQLWFIGHKPRNWVRTYEQNFPARLFFYRKGVGFYIETSGVARIAKKEELVTSSDIKPGTVLFKMIPSYIEYIETAKQHSLSGVSRPVSQLYNWLMHLLTDNNSTLLRFTSQQKTKGYG